MTGGQQLVLQDAGPRQFLDRVLAFIWCVQWCVCERVCVCVCVCVFACIGFFVSSKIRKSMSSEIEQRNRKNRPKLHSRLKYEMSNLRLMNRSNIFCLSQCFCA